jgi:DNA replicative helicase MCM subunit Mcm2 (Cdc46/Mcm family)
MLPDQVPAGSLPRTLEVIFRNDTVEQARAGDKLVFAGCMVVVPDVAAITAPGQRSQVKGAGDHMCPRVPTTSSALCCALCSHNGSEDSNEQLLVPLTFKSHMQWTCASWKHA